jgi:adenosylmethionine-8-amino-7-oxononanoate aminotransferase
MYFTFSGADLGCAVSKTVLELLRQEDLVNRAATMGARLRSRLEEVLGDHPNVADIRGLGLMQGLELTQASGEPFPASAGFAMAVVTAALELGVWLYPCGSGPVVDGILFGPPYTITDVHIDLMVATTRTAIDRAVAELSS